MTTVREVRVTIAEKDAARIIVERARAKGKPVSESIHKIANARRSSGSRQGRSQRTD